MKEFLQSPVELNQVIVVTVFPQKTQRFTLLLIIYALMKPTSFFLADVSNSRIRKVDLSTGIIENFLGGNPKSVGIGPDFYLVIMVIIAKRQQIFLLL